MLQWGLKAVRSTASHSVKETCKTHKKNIFWNVLQGSERKRWAIADWFLSQVCNSVKLSAWTCFHLVLRSVLSELLTRLQLQVHSFPLSISKCQGSMCLQWPLLLAPAPSHSMQINTIMSTWELLDCSVVFVWPWEASMQ